MLDALKTHKQRVAQLVVASLFALGIWVVAIFTIGPASIALATYFQSQRGSEPRMVVLHDGAAAIWSLGRRDTQQYHDLNGKSSAPTAPAVGYQLDAKDTSLATMRTIFGSSRPWVNRTAGFAVGGADWYLVRSAFANTAWFEGFERRRQTRIGYLGANGFHLRRPSGAECFKLSGDFGRHHISAASWRQVLGHGPLSNVHSRNPKEHVLLATQEGLVRIDFKEYGVESVSDVKGIVAIEGSDLSTGANPDASYTVAIRTDKEVMLLDRVGTVLDRIEIPKGHEEATPTLWPYSDSEIALSSQKVNAGSIDRKFFWFERSGENASATLLREEDAGTVDMTAHLGVFEWLGSFLVPVPFACWFAPTWLFAIGAILVGAILGALTWLKEARVGGKQSMWTLFVIVFGIPGYVGYRLQTSRAKEVSCGACSQPIPRRRTSCLGCGELLPLPVATGVEIYA